MVILGGEECSILSFVYICSSSYQKGRIGISLPGLTLPHMCALPKRGSGLPTSYAVVVFMLPDVVFNDEVNREDGSRFTLIFGAWMVLIMGNDA